MPVRTLLTSGILLAAFTFPAVAQLSGQPGPAPAPAPATGAPVIGLNYVAPLSPAAITQVQDRLRNAGDYTGRVDGVWGADSQTALERFQQRNGLQATGVMNPGTAATLRLTPADLFSLPAPVAPTVAMRAPEPTPPANTAPVPITTPVIRNVQASLRALGLYAGFIDGTWGPFTQAALVRFQNSRGLPADGQLTPATLQALGLDPANPSYPPR